MSLTATDLDQIKNIVTDGIQTLVTPQFDEVYIRLDKIDSRIDVIDGRLENLEKTIAEVELRLTRLEKEVRELGERVEDLVGNVKAHESDIHEIYGMLHKLEKQPQAMTNRQTQKQIDELYRRTDLLAKKTGTRLD